MCLSWVQTGDGTRGPLRDLRECVRLSFAPPKEGVSGPGTQPVSTKYRRTLICMDPRSFPFSVGSRRGGVSSRPSTVRTGLLGRRKRRSEWSQLVVVPVNIGGRSYRRVGESGRVGDGTDGPETKSRRPTGRRPFGCGFDGRPYRSGNNVWQE